MTNRHFVQWIDSGVEPRSPPDPRYPDGVNVDMSRGRSQTCVVVLRYPARRCGRYEIVCNTCGLTAVVTTAGRPDDPRSVTLACKGH